MYQRREGHLTPLVKKQATDRCLAPANVFPAATHRNNLVPQVTVPLGWLPTTSPGRGHSRSQQDPGQGTKTQTQERRLSLSRSRGEEGDGTLASHLPTVEGDTGITLLCVSLHSEERQDIKQGLDPRVGTTSQKHSVLTASGGFFSVWSLRPMRKCKRHQGKSRAPGTLRVPALQRAPSGKHGVLQAGLHPARQCCCYLSAKTLFSDFLYEPFFVPQSLRSVPPDS